MIGSLTEVKNFSQHKSRVLVFMVFGIFALLRYLAQFEVFANLVVYCITISPFLLIFFFALWMFIKDKEDHIFYQALQQKDAFLWIFFKISLAILVLFMIFFPETWQPAVMLLAFIPKFLSTLQMDDYFLLASYVGILAVTSATIFFLIRLYQKSQGTYQGSMHRLFKGTLYGTFCLLFFLFAFSAWAYPQAYAPVENILADAMVQVVGQSTPGTNINPVLSYMQKISKDVKNNAEDNALKNSVQAGKITQSEADLIQQNRELAKTASELDKASSQLNNQADKLNRTNADLDSQSSLLGSLGQALTDTKDNLVSQISGTTTDLSTSLSASTATLTQSIADTSASLSAEITSKLASTGGTVSGDLIVSGNLSPTGGITFAPAQTFNTATLTELGYVRGVTSNLQTQLDAKQATLTFGNVTSATTGLSVTNGNSAIIGSGVAINIQNSDTTHNGLLTATDWNTFNLKQNALGFTPVNRVGDTMSGTLNLPSNGLAVGTNQLVVSGGNVGIGTTTPGTTMDVNGSLTVSDDNYLKLGQAYFSSGGNFFNIGTNEWFNGAWQFNGTAGTMFQATGSSLRFYKHNGAGSHTILMDIESTGNVGIGTTAPYGKLNIGVAPTASANYGTLSLGGGAFDGSALGHFAGSSSGTSIAVNEVTGYAGDLMDLQMNGVSRFKMDNVGNIFGVNFYGSSIVVVGASYAVQIRSNSNLSWSSTTIANGSPDTFLGRYAAGVVGVGGSVGTGSLQLSSINPVSGKVGIGTTAPTGKLHLQDG